MDTIKLIHSFTNINEEHKKVFDYMENNFGAKRNELNPDNRMDNFKLYRLYFVKNLKIKLYANRVLLQGSIPIFYKGNNILQISDEEIINAFDKIQSILPFVDWQKSTVSRLDVGPCFKLPFTPNIITSLIIGSKYGKKVVFKSAGDTILIGNKSHQFEIYNKSIQSEYWDDNIVRLEYRMLKASLVGKMFGCKSITLSYLLNHLRMLPEIWYKMYQNLEKDYSPVFNTIRGKLDLASVLYHAYGYGNVLELIERSFKSGHLSGVQRTNLKRFVRGLQKNGSNVASIESPIMLLDTLAENYFLGHKYC